MKEDIKEGILTELSGSDYLLISFGGIAQGLGFPVFEFFNSLKDISCDKIFIRDYAQAWYQKGIDKKIPDIDHLKAYLESILENNQYKEVCFLGNSMGGYAAILFGLLLNTDQVISFAPQSFIDKWNRFIHLDLRWRKELKPVHNNPHKQKFYFDLKNVFEQCKESQTRIFIYYHSGDRLDRIHAERLGKYPHVHLKPVSGSGHGVAKTVRNSGELNQIIRDLFTPNASLPGA